MSMVTNFANHGLWKTQKIWGIFTNAILFAQHPNNAPFVWNDMYVLLHIAYAVPFCSWMKLFPLLLLPKRSGNNTRVVYTITLWQSDFSSIMYIFAGIEVRKMYNSQHASSSDVVAQIIFYAVIKVEQQIFNDLVLKHHCQNSAISSHNWK